MQGDDVHPSNGPGAPVDLRDDGLLWLINTVVFHPRGFALAWNPKTGDFLLTGDGSERWRFDEDSEPSNDSLWAAAEAAFERARRSEIRFRGGA